MWKRNSTKHWYQFEKTWFRIKVHNAFLYTLADKSILSDRRNAPSQLEMTYFAWNGQAFFHRFLESLAASHNYLSVDARVTLSVFTYNFGEKDWNETLTEKRSMESVYLDPSLKKDIVHEMDLFQQQYEKYERLCIPYQKGFLFYGVPGSGKTSLVKAIATKYKYAIYNMPLGSDQLTDENIGSLFAKASANKTMYLFEDIDHVLEQAGLIEPLVPLPVLSVGKEKTRKQLTLSGLLNALNGVGNCASGCLMIMTTNQIERLPPALIRAGRIDKKYFIDYPTTDQILLMGKAFYCEEENVEKKILAFLQLLKKKRQVTTAVLQNYFLSTPLGMLSKNIDHLFSL